MINNFFKNKNRGYTMVEFIFYATLLAVVSIVVINSMIIMTKSFKKTAVQNELVQSGSIMERIAREVRQAYGINSISASNLKLDSKDINGVNKIVEFLLSGNNIQLLEDNVLTGNLNTPSIIVTALTFTQITTTRGKAVKIFLTLHSSNDILNTNQDFYDTVVLRGDY